LASFEIWEVAVSFAAGIVSGIIVGVIVEHFRLRHTLRVEKIKRLAPHLEAATPLVTRIDEHAEFAMRMIHASGGHDPSVQITNLKSALNQYVDWYSQFQEKGMRPELESIDRELYDRMTGLFNLSRFSSSYGDAYVSQNVEAFHKGSSAIRSKLNRFWR
jgi:hypothetical protein